MHQRPSGIRYLPGKNKYLIMAPHGPFIDGEFQNDIRTSIITEHIQQTLDCHAIINDLFFKPKGPIKKSFDQYFLDLYRIDHSRKVDGYLSRIEEIVKNGPKTYVVWVHGITDDVAVVQGREHRELGLFNGSPENLHCLIGYGQGGDPKTGETRDRFSARQETVETIRDLHNARGLNTVLTHPEGSNYRGRDAKRLNQWFNQLGYGLDRVESFHLELREKDCRDSEESAIKTAGIIAEALNRVAEK